MICEACGESNRPGTEFCAFCGSYLAWDPAAATAAAPDRTAREAAPPAPTSTPASAPAPTPVAPTAPPAPTPTPAPTPAAAPPPYAPSPVTAEESAEAPCPACGRTNPSGRRFCAHCGHRLLADAGAARVAAPAPAARSGSWWSRLFDNRDRAARREYRRSLPALYRWRRVLVVLGLLAGLVAGLAVAGRDPVGFVVARYHDVRGNLVAVPVTAVAVEPPDATVPKSKPEALTDRTEAAWTMHWEPAAEGSSCGGTPGTGVIVLTIAPTRVRALAIQAGLLASDGRRTLQARPLKLGVTFDGGPCQTLDLKDDAAEQTLEIDSTVPVSTIRIGVDAVQPQREDGEPVLSVTEIGVRARPA